MRSVIGRPILYAMRAKFPLFVSLAALVFSGSMAQAEWPIARHNVQRTGAGSAKSNLTDPVPYWRAYLGGTLSIGQLIPAEVNGDGVTDFVYASAGRIFARTADDKPLWQSDRYQVTSVVGVADLDGDGKAEVVATNAGQVLVLDASTGKLLWAEAPGEMGTIGGVRLNDVDGDKLPDVLVYECGCCAIFSGKSGFAYSFKGSVAAPKQLWSFPNVTCGGARSLALFDADNDGVPEVVSPANSGLGALDGKTGSVLASSVDLGSYAGSSVCLPANIDGVPGDELVCFKNVVGATPSGHRVFALRLKKGPTSTFDLLWSRDVGSADGGLITIAHSVVDLDGDGSMELIVGGRAASGNETYVIDPRTGTTLATIPNALPSGTIESGLTKETVVVTRSLEGTSAWKFTRAATPGTVLRWSLPNVKAADVYDAASSSQSMFTSTMASVDADGDGRPDLVTTGLSTAELSAYSLIGAMPTSIASSKLPPETNVSGIWPMKAAGGSPLAIARTDGVLLQLDKALKATTAGVRFGGYSGESAARQFLTTPVVGSLGAAAQSVIVPDSRGSLLRLDPIAASLSSPPTPAWSRAKSNAPAIVKDLFGSGRPGVVCRGEVPSTSQTAVAALDPMGKDVWKATVDGTVTNDIIPVKSASGTDLVYQWGKSGDLLLRTTVLVGLTGTVKWDASPVDPAAGRQPLGMSLIDWNGDGTDDIVFQASGTKVLDGATGISLATGGPPDAYALATIADGDGDGTPEIIYSGGNNPTVAFKKNLTTKLWTGQADDKAIPFGAVATCAGGAVFAHSSWKNTARLTVTRIADGMASQVVLAGGKIYGDEAAAAADGAKPGQLSSPSVHPNLSGDSRPVVVVGSTDGWLYGVRACDRTLVFSRQFGAAVGEPVFGDTDGDGNDEIIVTVGDGYIYGLRQKTVPAPEYVWDTLPGATGTADIDETPRADAVAAKWAAVDGATGYELSVVDGGGKALLSPQWKDVGNVTEATIDGLSLSVGQTYSIAVRAVGAAGTSSDQASDGVRVIATAGDGGLDAGGPAPGGGGEGEASCSCSMPAGGGYGAGLAALGAVGAALVRRRRRR